MNLIIGRKPVLEAINSGEELEQVFLLHGQRGGIIDAIRIASKKRGIKCSEVKPERFKSITQNPNAQGVAALKLSQKYFSLQEIIDSSKKSIHPLILVLDSIQDPHNLGAILRTAECAGVEGIVLTKHNSAPVNETVIKTSAGAAEIMKIVPVNNLSQALKELKENGFWIAGTSLENSKNYLEPDYKIPLALVLGNEEKGIRRLTAESCDFLIKIPLKGKIQSLNVSVAAGVLLFEILRKRSQAN
ncbi:MAG TPA: 23S rRNA (guanosine(2251)-2'-O)-methyltransferase RlmB [Ignavibacteriaceae bacterium]|nr:23S rRNA (guanosine(2251)-2'-O)-methyltransferase RlmB [Ignavibacteriaceae bacterium]